VNRFRYATAAALLLLVLSAGPASAQTKVSGDIAGDWTASVLGQTVTANFVRQGDTLTGVVVVPDLGGGSNTYHVIGFFHNGQFVARHASGHVLQGAMTGPNEAQAVFKSKSAPTLTLTLLRRPLS
jgi:hypothetical protein